MSLCLTKSKCAVVVATRANILSCTLYNGSVIVSGILSIFLITCLMFRFFLEIPIQYSHNLYPTRTCRRNHRSRSDHMTANACSIIFENVEYLPIHVIYGIFLHSPRPLCRLYTLNYITF